MLKLKPKISPKMRTFLILGIVFASFIGLFYWLTKTQSGLRFVWKQANRSLPGNLTWEKIEINYKNQSVQIKNLHYSLKDGQSILELKDLKAEFALSSLFRTKAILRNLNVNGVILDLSKIPPKKESKKQSDILDTLSKRLSIENSEFNDIDLLFKNASLKIPRGTLVYKTGGFEKDVLNFAFQNISLQSSQKKFGVQQIEYEGKFTGLGIVKKILPYQHAEGLLKIKGVETSQLFIQELSTEVEYQDNDFYFKQLDIAINKNTYQLNLKINPFTQKLETTFKTASPALLSDIPYLNTKRVAEVYDKFFVNLNLSLEGFKLEEMKGNASLYVEALGNRINPKTPLSKLNLKSSFENSKLLVSQVTIENELTKVKGNGEIDFKTMNLNSNFEGTHFDLATLLAMLSDLEVKAMVDFKGSIKGPLKKPDFYFEGLAREGSYKFLNFGDVDGNFEIKNGQMKYEGKSVAASPVQAQALIVAKDIFSKDSRATSLDIGFTKVPIDFLMKNPQMKGLANGALKMQVSDRHIDGKIKAQIDDLHYYSLHFGKVDSETSFGPGRATISPISFENTKLGKVSLGEATFNFDDHGFKLKAQPLKELAVEGNYFNSSQSAKLNFKSQKLSLALLGALLEKEIPEGYLDAQADLNIVSSRPELFNAQIKVSQIHVPWGEIEIHNQKEFLLNYARDEIKMAQAFFNVGSEIVEMKGAYQFVSENINLNLKGNLDLSLLTYFRYLVRSASGLAKLDLNMLGKLENLSWKGQASTQGAELFLRSIGNPIENLKGKLEFSGNQIHVDNLSGEVVDGDIKINGDLWHKNWQMEKSDLKIEAREISLAKSGVYKIYLSSSLSLKGNAPQMTLAGNVDLTEGRYIKNFDIRELIIKEQQMPSVETSNSFLDDIKLNLKVRSPGELLVKNNIAEIYLKTDLQVLGTKKDPKVQGAVEVLDGTFKYFRLNFENAKGSIDLRNANNPILLVTAQREFDQGVESYIVNAKIEGPLNNLQLSFSSEPPLEKKEVLSLVFTGALPGQNVSLSGASLAGSVLASQLTSVLEGPITGATKLDIFRFEATDPDSKNFASLVVGKKLTDRLSLEFKTDIGAEESVRSLQAEYLLFDNLLLKAARNTAGKYRLDLTYRFKGY